MIAGRQIAGPHTLSKTARGARARARPALLASRLRLFSVRAHPASALQVDRGVWRDSVLSTVPSVSSRCPQHALVAVIEAFLACTLRGVGRVRPQTRPTLLPSSSVTNGSFRRASPPARRSSARRARAPLLPTLRARGPPLPDAAR